MPNVFCRPTPGLAQGLCWALFIASGINVFAQLPDLTVDRPRLQSSISVETRTFATDSCTVVEGCALPGTRKLLLFDTGFINIGTNDLIIGDPAQRPDIFHFSPCHGHYHMDGVAGYELIDAAGTTVVTGRKQGFCLRDSEPALPGAGPAKYDCNYQGLTAGWEDIYDKSLDCQWLDISDVPSGSYRLRVVCNPDAMLEESNYENNVVDVSITLGTTNNPPDNPKPPKCGADWWKKHCKKPQTWKDLKDKWGDQWWKKCKLQKCECENHPHDGKDEDDDEGDVKGDDDDHHDGKGSGDCQDHGNSGKHKAKGKNGHDQGKHKGKGKGKGHK